MSFLALALAVTPQVPQADEAARLLAEAETKVARGRYADAVRAYQAIASVHAGTPAAKVAARRSRGNALLGWTPMKGSKPIPNRLDIVVAGDGYELDHLDAFENQAEDVLETLERNETLREYWSYLAFTRAVVVSRENGVDAHGRNYDTALGGYDTGKIDHDVDVDRGLAHEMLAEIPQWDGVAVVLVRGGLRGTGGDGIAAAGEREPAHLVRAFGGALAGLGDELDEDQGVYIPIAAQPNISASEKPSAVPWRHWIKAGVSGIGVYPGGLGRVNGVFKPVSSNCAMNGEIEYCPVCREAMVLAIHRHVDPIERATPEPESELSAGRKMEFGVEVMRPDSHALEVLWYVLPERGAPTAPKPRAGMESALDRRTRGPLSDIAVEPSSRTKPDRKGFARFKLDATRLDPGRHRVVCRVTDTTPVGGKEPWVLADPDGLLQSERGWWVRVD